MSITIAQMKAVEALARTGKFSLAADDLGISQPTISSQVQAFERLCSRRVFIRNGYTVQLAPGAEELLAKIRITLKCLADVDEAIGAGAQLTMGSLSFGFSAHRLVMNSLTAFVQKYPNVRLNTHGGPSLKLMEDVLSGALDIAAVSMERPDSRLYCAELSRSRVMIYGRKGHPALQTGFLPMQALAQEKLVLWNQSSGTRKLLDQAAEQQNFKLNCILEVSTLDVAYASAAAGIGLCCAIEGEVQPDENIDVVPLEPKLEIGHYLVCLPECRDHAAVNAFLEVAGCQETSFTGAIPKA